MQLLLSGDTYFPDDLDKNVLPLNMRLIRRTGHFD